MTGRGARSAWAWARPVGGAGILGVLVWRLGTGPFLDGLRGVTAGSLLAALALTGLATVCSAWRWQVVARGLGVGLGLREAVAAYYSSQFLNSALPGGVLGDVHRGVQHGRDAGDVGRGLRAVAWERAAGQGVQVALLVVVLCTLASPVRPAMGRVLAGVAVGAVVVALALVVARTRFRGGTSGAARVLRAARDDVRAGLLHRRAWPVVAGTSVVVAAAHTGTFLVAAWSTGVQASPARLWPLAMLVLFAMVLPVGIGGWGPREGVAAWVFAAAGLGAAQGVAAATAYGVLGLLATLPGAVVLVAGRVRRGRLRAAAVAVGNP